ncbi:MAG TPA: NmrA/HSCARG family protein [Gemmatimonadales bacterium]|nr:NmrA/HSCARG family protein [Gemmatimonadales bacterium]
MPDPKIIAVVGATGAQGGGLARAILADRSAGRAGGFAVRALTRHPESAKARALAEAGAEVVAADLDDEASLARAFAGAHGAFCVTNFWEHFSPEREIAQAGNMARAARSAGVRHAIWSTLEDTRRWVPLDDDRMPTLQGRYKVPHFDAKGEADQLFRDAGVPTTYLLASYYWENLLRPGTIAPDAGGTLVLTYPMGDEKLAGIAAEDIGRCAWGVFRRGTELAGRAIGIAGEHLTGAEMAAKLARALGRPVRYQAIEPAAMRAAGFPGADEFGNMFQFYRDFSGDVLGMRDVAAARALNPALETFDQWLQEHAREIPLG